MARKLPWAAGTTSTPTTDAKPTPTYAPPLPPPKKHKPSTPTKPKPEPPSSPSLSSPRHRPRPTNTTSTTRTNNNRYRHRDGRARTPSTSPPPAPPPITFMHEGLDQDDGYMLVEDEFCDIATGFTAHLHHAEYKRLMREAQERKIAQKTAFGLAVPEDATVEMKQRMKRDALGEKQSAGLKAMLGNGLARDSDEEEEEGEEDAVAKQEKKIGDPWAGTTLAGLMRFEPGNARTSLRGLEGVRSCSRAALGFGPATTTAATATTTGMAVAEETRKRRNEDAKDEVRPVQNDKLHSDRRELNTTTTTARQPSVEAKKESTIIKTEPANPPLQNHRIKQESDQKTSQLHLHVSAPRRKYHKFIDDLDDFDDDLFELHNNGTQAQPRRTQGQSTSPSKVKSLPRPRLIKKEVKDDNGKYDGRLDEVPIFLA